MGVFQFSVALRPHKLTRDGIELRTAASTFTQLLGSDTACQFCSVSLYVHSDHQANYIGGGESRTVTSTFTQLLGSVVTVGVPEAFVMYNSTKRASGHGWKSRVTLSNKDTQQITPTHPPSIPRNSKGRKTQRTLTSAGCEMLVRFWKVLG